MNINRRHFLRSAVVLPALLPAALPPSTAAHTARHAAPHAAPIDQLTTDAEPLLISEMRKRSYPGSEMMIEEALRPAATYNRYIVSYLSDGLKIRSYFTLPRGKKPATGWPVVIFNHGFIPPNVYRTTERYIGYQDAFARNGYIVMRSDYRGHDKSEGEAAGGYGTPAYTVDVLNGMSSVLKHPDADVNRVGMWGHSMMIKNLVITSKVTDNKSNSC